MHVKHQQKRRAAQSRFFRSLEKLVCRDPHWVAIGDRGVSFNPPAPSPQATVQGVCVCVNLASRASVDLFPPTPPPTGLAFSADPAPTRSGWPRSPTYPIQFSDPNRLQDGSKTSYCLEQNFDPSWELCWADLGSILEPSKPPKQHRWGLENASKGKG